MPGPQEYNALVDETGRPIIRAEDTAHVSGQKGFMLLAVRQDTATALAGTSGDYIPLIVDASGRIHISTAPANDGVDIGNVDVASIVPGTGATSLGKAEDAIHGDGDTGVMLLAVRKDTASALAGADGDYIPIIVDASGRVHIAPAPANSGVDIGDVDITSIIPGTGATNLGKAVDAIAGATDSGVATLAVRDDALGALTPIEGDYINLRVDANGALWTHDDALDAALSGSEIQVDIVAALPTGANTIGKVDVTSVIPGTGATNSGKAVDAVAGATDTGAAVLAVRDDALGALAPIEGDYVNLRTDANGALWTHDDALDAALSGSELQVDIVAALPTGSNAIGKLAANTGVDIGDVDVTSVIPGTGATNLGKAIDSAVGATDTGIVPLAVRDDALSALTPIESDYVPLRTDANGALWTHDDALDAALGGSELQVDVVAALPAGTNAIGKLAANDGVDIGDVGLNLGGSIVEGLTTNSDGIGASNTGIAATAVQMQFNGSTLDRARGNVNATVLSSAARTTTTSSADQTNYSGRGLHVYIKSTAIVDTPSITVKIEGKDSVSGDYYTILEGVAIASITTQILKVYPGLVVAANSVANDVLPRTWRITATHADADSITYSVGASVIL